MGMSRVCRVSWALGSVAVWGLAGTLAAQTASPSPKAATAQKLTTTPGRVRPPDVLKVPTPDDLLRGAYGPYRANNDLLSYKLKLRVDPEAKTIAGSNTVRFRMLQPGQKIQLELTPLLTIDSVTFDGKPAKFERDATEKSRTFYVEFPRELKKDSVDEITIAYHGQPVTQGRFGCFSFDKDKAGKPWITTACEEEGASIWWPNKDQWKDEPQEGMELDIAVPNGLTDVSNGRFVASKDLGDGYTEWQWQVHYPINNYDVALNIGDYQHWNDVHVNKETGEKTTLDYYALPEDLEKAKVQFAQVPEMLDAYEHYFGEYPFDKDGYKLIQVPYAGMEHQSAVAYGNHFENGYYGRDWTGVGISMKFDFIIIHESGHEWFGNAITAADKSDMWIHEGWTTYLEVLYVEYRWGKADAIRYVNGLKPKVQNERPIITPRDTNAEPPQDQYFKGALMLNTLRSVIGDDKKWFADIHDFYQAFKYKTIMTEEVEAWWNKRTGMNLTPFFDEYLRHKDLPVLELKAGAKAGEVEYRWKADEAAFAMPIEIGDPQHWTKVTPVTTTWKAMPWTGTLEEVKVASDFYYVNVVKE
ncbi:M1 family metallopeptidase [Granulicella paludicola]|uniref:M1 family metallopeptidase n=1 Tax=Granulicella paludicola TaxID=474951 RepID=UPI0021DF63FF|nr:M1 family metallopeptidase [Granulicella paludicola]